MNRRTAIDWRVSRCRSALGRARRRPWGRRAAIPARIYWAPKAFHL